VLGSEIRQRLRQGLRVYGTHVASLMNPVAAKMSTQMELDFAFICTEHMPLDRTEVSMMCQLYAAHGISPIVRVPSPDPTAISMALDGGAEGITVPYVETVEEVRRCAGAIRYRPIKGKLLRDAMDGQTDLSAKTQQFLEQFNRSRYLIIGVESVAAIDNLENLLAAGEVDGVFLGPHDITTSMGIPTEYDNPLFLDLVEDVVRRCRKCNVGVGLHTNLLKLGEDVAQRFLDAGMNWLIHAADITVMHDAMNAQLGRLRQLAGDEAFQAEQANVEKQVVESCLSAPTTHGDGARADSVDMDARY